VGHVVLVPLGRTGETGYVVDLTDDPGPVDPAKVKPITRITDPLPAFQPEDLPFFEWVSRYYLAPLGMVLHTAVPTQLGARVVRVVHPTDRAADALTERSLSDLDALVLREVIGRPGLTPRGLARRLSNELDSAKVRSTLNRLVKHELLLWQDKQLDETRARVRVASLTMAHDDALAQAGRAGRRMRAVMDALAEAPLDVPVLVAQQGQSARDALKRLVDRGVAKIEEREWRDALSSAPALGRREAPELNSDQRSALDALTADDCDGTFLLYGVTGAGKTEVFLGAASATLARGKQVLVLVPEIGLTPQLVGRFRARFGDDVAVLHSGLTGRDRLAHWRRIRAGEARIAVGARSCLFAPFAQLGMVVVDEEHDDSYKQDDGVAYHARDLAVLLGRQRGCPVVLASATPSLESWYNARTGRYHLLELPKRATPRPVPQVELVDLTSLEPDADGKRPLLHPDVADALHKTFERGGQAIVLYNRRGFATMVECTSCGATYECPNCGVTMTLHRRSWRVVCHYCGLKRDYSEDCTVCGANTVEELGKGTERIEETLRAQFPDVSVARMDADTTAARGAHQRILTDFREGRTQLLIGTQIVAKGHDFPGVHTAVVVSADRGFRMPDFRAAERTYALLVQMAGRAGRGDHPGRVLVQTYNPGHYVLKHLDDVKRFVDVELRLRATLRYPPISRLTLVRVEGADRRRAMDTADSLARQLRAAARPCPDIDILGPAAAALPRIAGRWRFQLILRGQNVQTYRRWLVAHRGVLAAAAGRGVRVAWDVDPRHLL